MKASPVKLLKWLYSGQFLSLYQNDLNVWQTNQSSDPASTPCVGGQTDITGLLKRLRDRPALRNHEGLKIVCVVRWAGSFQICMKSLGVHYLSSPVNMHPGVNGRLRCWPADRPFFSCQNIIVHTYNVTSWNRKALFLWLCVTDDNEKSVFCTANQPVMLIGHVYRNLCCGSLVLWVFIMYLFVIYLVILHSDRLLNTGSFHFLSPNGLT